MSNKKTSSVSTTKTPALKIGSRVRCTDDGVEGRIVWANAISVKIRWDDGEQVTWRRDALSSKSIEILAADADSDNRDQTEAPVAASASEQTISTERPPEDLGTTPRGAEQTTAFRVCPSRNSLPF